MKRDFKIYTIKKKGYKIFDFVEKEDLIKLEKFANEGKQLRLNHRNILLFRLLYSTGLRVSEVSNLKKSHINQEEMIVKVI